MTKWIVSNCESCGPLHTVCQDHTAFFHNDIITIVALSDGLSSSPLSDKGALIATEATCDEISQNFSKYYTGQKTKNDFVNAIQKKIKDSCDDMDDYHKMKCTLLFCAICNDQYLMGHIGDGAILCFGESTRVISKPQETALGGTATYTILDYNAGDNIVFQKGNTERCDGFLLTSDGLLGNVYYSSGTEVPQLAYDLFSSVVTSFDKDISKEDRDNEFKAFLYESIQKDNQLADDCSLAIITRETFTGLVDYECENGLGPDILWPCICGKMNRMDEIRCSCCRKLYLDIYSDAIINISSKEGFFSRLNSWIQSDNKGHFNPDTSAIIINSSEFNDLCVQLKSIHNSDLKVEQTINDCKGAELTNPDSTSILSREPVSTATKPFGDSYALFDIGIKAGKSLFHGLKQIVGGRTDFYKGNEKRKAENKQRSSEKIDLWYSEMLEASFQMGYLPIEYIPIGKGFKIPKEKKYIVETMYEADQYIDYCEAHIDIMKVTRIYVRDKSIVIICDNKEDLFEAHVLNLDEIGFEEVLRELGFSRELINNIKLKPHSDTTQNLIINWDWHKAVYYARRDASRLFDLFCKELGRNGENRFSHLASSEKKGWLIGKRKNYTEIVAFVIVNDYLYMIRSINEMQVQIMPIDAEEASNNTIDFLKKYILSNNELNGGM